MVPSVIHGVGYGFGILEFCECGSCSVEVSSTSKTNIAKIGRNKYLFLTGRNNNISGKNTKYRKVISVNSQA